MTQKAHNSQSILKQFYGLGIVLQHKEHRGILQKIVFCFYKNLCQALSGNLCDLYLSVILPVSVLSLIARLRLILSDEDLLRPRLLHNLSLD